MSALFAGFARENITPAIGGIPLAGYGITHLRPAARVLDPIYVNTVALQGASGERFVLLTLDMISLKNELIGEYRAAISESTGLPEDHVFLGGTHTHSAPDHKSPLETMRVYLHEYLPPILIRAARRALADLKPAAVSYGSIEVGRPGMRLNFVRHYLMTDRDRKDDPAPEDAYEAGDNYGEEYSSNLEKYRYIGHEEPEDPELQLVKLSREDADDILFINFQAHATITGGRLKPDLSADYPGVLVREAETLLPGTRAIYLQGAAGNLNPATQIEEESIPGITFGKGYGDETHRAYAHILASHVMKLLDKGLTPSVSDELAFATESFTGELDHTTDALLPLAEEVWAIYKDEGNTPRIRALCKEKGFYSPYQCGSIRRRAQAGLTREIELNVLRIGDCGLIMAPYEMFCGSGKYIKEHSPFALTLIKAYSCGYHSYMPTKNATPACYERHQTPFVLGTAEKLAEEYVKLLETLA